MLADSTNGITVGKSGDSGYERLYKHVYDKKVVEQSFSAILITGYQPIELKGKLSAYNGIDTDEDTLTDWEEVGVEHWIEKGLINYDVSGTIMLPTIEQCMKFTECSYVEEGLARFQSDYAENFGAAIAGARVLPILSDPTREDSDEDGLLDAAPQYYNDKMIAPKDNTPLKYDGSKGAWSNHVEASKTNMVTEYSSDYGPMKTEVVNKFLTVIDSDFSIELDTVDSKMLNISFSADVVVKIPCNSIKDLWTIFVAFLIENQEYIHLGGQAVENSMWFSLNLFNGLLNGLNPCIEIAPEQLEDFINNSLDFLERNYIYRLRY